MTEQISRMYSESSQNTQVKAESTKQTKRKELTKERISAKTKETSSDTKNAEKERALEEKKIRQAIDEANQRARFTKKSFEYSVDDKTNRISITVRDQETDEVIKEIPSEETLNMLAKIWELAGIVVDEKM